MFLRANARQGGLDDRGQPRQATYAAAMGPSGVAAVAAHCWNGILLLQAQGDHWLLEDRGEPLSYTAFNARLPDIVQVGGVWTPPALRGRGYARCAVAGSLLEARAGGARRAILFTSSASAARA